MVIDRVMHFGDTNGLLVAVATQAFDGFTAAREAGNARGADDSGLSPG